MLLQKGILLPILAAKFTITTIQSYPHNVLPDVVLSSCLEGEMIVGSFAFPLSSSVVLDDLRSISGVFLDLLQVSIVFVYLCLQDQIVDMKTGPKPIGRLLIPKILQVLEEASCDLRTWTITVRLRESTVRPRLRWETVHKYLEQMVQGQMIFRYEDPSGIVTYSKNPIVREKVLF